MTKYNKLPRFTAFFSYKLVLAADYAVIHATFTSQKLVAIAPVFNR
ncbi:hypothetical protein [Cylindrospermum sp. FACHB-282]|nr:hypothetical protein [Cylindrospermum sp. FACHB-282]MBD2384094.1 hypothetical protein [Cylindrospermum sp. FACHB-282]